MKKLLLLDSAAFSKWKNEQINEYKDCWSPAEKTTKEIEEPKQFPAVVIYDDFDDADSGMFFFYEFVYLSDFNEEISKLKELLSKAKTVIDKAFEYEGDVFGIEHNFATDTISEIESVLK